MPTTTTPTQNAAFLRNIYRKGPFQGHGFCCVPPLTPLYEMPGHDFTLSTAPLAPWIADVVDYYRRSVALQAAIGDDSVPMARISTGTHIYAAAFGCRVEAPADNSPFAHPLVRTAAEADALPEPDIWKTPALYRVFELADKVVAELGPDVPLSVPDMQSGFDTAALVWNKEDLFVAMVTEPEAVQRLAAKCARLFKTFLAEFRRAFPNASPCHCPVVWAPPEMGPWLSNDECGIMSPAAFEQFCLPELIDLAETFGGLGMHCCADAEHQFAAFNRIPDFYAFNRVAARLGYDTLLEHFDADGPVHVIGWVDEETITRLVRNAPEGMRFIFNLLEADAETGKAWYDAMRQLSPRTD